MIRSNLCGYSDAYIVVKGEVIVSEVLIMLTRVTKR